MITRFALLSLFLLSVALISRAAPVEQRLGVMRASFETTYANEVAKVHDAAVAELNAKYFAALDRSLANATQNNELESALALRDEKARVESGEPMPADDDGADSALRPLRQTYRSALGALEARRDELAAPIKARYDQALEALQAELTRAGELDGALAVKQAREAWENNKAASAAAAPSEEAAPADPSATAPPSPAMAPTSQEISAPSSKIASIAGHRLVLERPRESAASEQEAGDRLIFLAEGKGYRIRLDRYKKNGEGGERDEFTYKETIEVGRIVIRTRGGGPTRDILLQFDEGGEIDLPKSQCVSYGSAGESTVGIFRMTPEAAPSNP